MIRPHPLGLIAAGALIGVGAATKITFMLTGLLFVPLLAVRPQLSLQRAVLLGGGAVAGFAASAPYAIVNWEGFLFGLNALKAQYAALHLPHAHMHIKQLGVLDWATGFFIILYGALFIAAFAAIAAPGVRRHQAALGLWIFAVMTFLFFGLQNVFFERNFGTVVVSSVLLSAISLSAVRSGILRALLVALTLGPMSYWSWQVGTSPKAGEAGRDIYATRNDIIIGASVWSIPPITVPACQGAVAINDYSDDVTPELVRLLTTNGYEQIGRYRSRFSFAPSSTLHTYLDTGAFFFRCKSEEARLY